MAKLKLTEVVVRGIKPPDRATRQVDYWDQLEGSFAMRVSCDGTKSWIVQPRVLRDGRWVPARITLGRYPAMGLSEAREKAREAKTLAQQGKDPRDQQAAERRALEDASRNTFDFLAGEFLVKHAERKGLKEASVREYRRTLEGDDTKAWRARPVTEITKRDVLDLLDTIMDRGCPILANKTLVRLKTFFRWCAQRDVITAAPTDRLSRPAKDVKRDRALTAAEVAEVWKAIEGYGGPFASLLKVLLLTGQRREEVGGMRWSELRDLAGENPAWEIPPERTKNGLPHVVPLAPAAVAILRTTDRVVGSPFVFTGRTEKTKLSGFSKAKRGVDALIAKARAKAGVRAAIPGWVIHDLRRTVSTRMNEDLGVLPHVVEAVLNHVSGARAGVAGTYNRALYLDDKRRALTAWAGYVEQLVSGKAGNVVRLFGGRGA